MTSAVHDGQRLWHEDIGQGSASPLLLLHGWGCDSTFLAHQAACFARSRRVVSVDLPAHGRSADEADVASVEAMSVAVAALCDDIGLTDAVVVGHSMGGTVALELARQQPDAVSGLVLLDTVVFPTPAFSQAIAGVAGLLETGDMLQATDLACASLFLPIDDRRVVERFRFSLNRMAPAMVARAFAASLLEYQPDEALAGWRKPIAFIGSESPFGNAARLASVCPQAKIGQVLGSGHFMAALVPDQVNALIAGFLAAYVDRR